MPAFMDKIHMISKDRTNYVYHAETQPLAITLIAKKPGEMEYQPTGTIVTALETFSTIVSLR
jgi:hypothetical protein